MEEDLNIGVHRGILANFENLIDKVVQIIIHSVISLPLMLMSFCYLLRTVQQYWYPCDQSIINCSILDFMLKIEHSIWLLLLYSDVRKLFASLNNITLIAFRQLLMSQMEHHKIPHQLTEVVLLQIQLLESCRISLPHHSYLLSFHQQQINRLQIYSRYLHVPSSLPRQWWGRQCSYIKWCPINLQDIL